MTREEAIDVLKRNYPSQCYEELCKAVDVAINSLSAQSEIIRCKDCKWWDNEDGAELCEHICGGMWAKPDAYCSYGERNERSI